MATAGAVEETLERYGRLTTEVILSLVEDVRTRAPVLAALVGDYPQRQGKAIRPSLLLATCQAFGGTVQEALGPAVSLEMLHNSFLIHDDIEDASARRRGRETLHRLHGLPLALNAGDALAMLALRPLQDGTGLGTRIQRKILGEYLEMAQRTVEGQARELELQRYNVVDFGPRDYLDLIGSKTCWYTTVYPLRVGALIGSRGAADLDAVSRFGFYLGAAFQIRDDVLNLVGEASVVGKDLLGDLREGKRTLMLSHVMQHAGPSERRWIEDYLGAPAEERTEEDVAALLQLMRDHRSIDFASDYGRGIAAAARETFPAAFAGAPSSPHKDFLGQMVDYMVDRTR